MNLEKGALGALGESEMMYARVGQSLANSSNNLLLPEAGGPETIANLLRRTAADKQIQPPSIEEQEQTGCVVGSAKCLNGGSLQTVTNEPL